MKHRNELTWLHAFLPRYSAFGHYCSEAGATKPLDWYCTNVQVLFVIWTYSGSQDWAGNLRFIDRAAMLFDILFPRCLYAYQGRIVKPSSARSIGVKMGYSSCGKDWVMPSGRLVITTNPTLYFTPYSCMPCQRTWDKNRQAYSEALNKWNDTWRQAHQDTPTCLEFELHLPVQYMELVDQKGEQPSWGKMCRCLNCLSSL